MLPDGSAGEWQANCEAKLRAMATRAGVAWRSPNDTLAVLATIRHDGQRTPLPPAKRTIAPKAQPPIIRKQAAKRATTPPPANRVTPPNTPPKQATGKAHKPVKLPSANTYVPGKLGYHCR